MKNTIKLIIFLLFCDFTLLSAEKLPTVDYKSIAAEITKGCSKKNDQARAIYRYLIQNIAYDTDYKIRDADECWKQKKGVCQAFRRSIYQVMRASKYQMHLGNRIRQNI